MKIRINTKLPQSWNELSEKQLQSIAFVLDHFHGLPKEQRKNPEQLKKLYIHLIKNLMRSNNWIKVAIMLRQIPPVEYVPYLQFLFSANKRSVFPKAFKLKGNTFYPPADRIKNMTMEEFSFVDSLYYNYRQNADVRYLDMLCATLYRTKCNNEIDIRKAFQRDLVDKYLKDFSKMKLQKKLAMLYAYEGSRNYITSLYSYIFPKPEESETTKKQLEKPKQSYVSFSHLMHYKVQFDTSKIEQTERLNIHKFLSIYENELRELEKQKQYGSGNA